MAEIDKTLNEAPTGVEEEITEEQGVTEDTPMEVEVEGDETVSIGPVPTNTETGFAGKIKFNLETSRFTDYETKESPIFNPATDF